MSRLRERTRVRPGNQRDGARRARDRALPASHGDRLQLDERAWRAFLRSLPAQSHRAQPGAARERGALGAHRARQATAGRRRDAPGTAHRRAERGSRARPGLRFRLQRALAHAGAHRSRQRTDHARHRRGRRFRARGAPRGDARALPHAHRPFPARDRALLFHAADRRRPDRIRVPRRLRRRAAGLRRRAQAPLRERRPAGLARPFHLRLRERTPLGGLGGDVRAFHAHRGDARHRHRDIADRTRRLARGGRLSGGGFRPAYRGVPAAH